VGSLQPSLPIFLYLLGCRVTTEPVFLNVYGAQESIPKNEFLQPMLPGGPVR
jgi:hypothetical protein